MNEFTFHLSDKERLTQPVTRGPDFQGCEVWSSGSLRHTLMYVFAFGLENVGGQDRGGVDGDTHVRTIIARSSLRSFPSSP